MDLPSLGAEAWGLLFFSPQSNWSWNEMEVSHENRLCLAARLVIHKQKAELYCVDNNIFMMEMGRRQSRGCGYIRWTGRSRDGVEGGGRPGLIANSVWRKFGNRQVGARGCVEEVKGPKVDERLWELGMKIEEMGEEGELGVSSGEWFGVRGGGVEVRLSWNGASLPAVESGERS